MSAETWDALMTALDAWNRGTILTAREDGNDLAEAVEAHLAHDRSEPPLAALDRLRAALRSVSSVQFPSRKWMEVDYAARALLDALGRGL